MANPWIEHVKRYAAANGLSYKDAMSAARASYKPVAGKRPARARATGPKTGCRPVTRGALAGSCRGYAGKDVAPCRMGAKGRCVGGSTTGRRLGGRKASYTKRSRPGAKQYDQIFSQQYDQLQLGGYRW